MQLDVSSLEIANASLSCLAVFSAQLLDTGTCKTAVRNSISQHLINKNAQFDEVAYVSERKRHM